MTHTETIRTSVRVFRYGYRFPGCPRKQMWAMWSEGQGIYFDDLNKITLQSAFTISELRQSSEREELTPEAALAELASWPEGQAELRRIFAEWPASEPWPFVYPSGFKAEYDALRTYAAELRAECEWWRAAFSPDRQVHDLLAIHPPISICEACKKEPHAPDCPHAKPLPELPG